MTKALLSAVAAGALMIGAATTPVSAGQVYGDYGQDPDAPYQGGGEGGYHDDTDQPPPPDSHRYRDADEYSYRGCEERTAVGTGLGAIIGGVIGNQFGRGGGRTAATFGGIILGGIAGNAIARDSCRNERADAYYYNRAYYDGFENPEYGRSYDWRNPYNGDYGYMSPVRDYDEGYRCGYDGSQCREFRQTIYIDGRRADGYGTACRDSDGSWRIVR